MERTCLVEIPRGSRNKYEYDENRNVIRLDRRLFSSVVYPADYGFLQGTLTDGGRHLDALVLVNEPTFPGCRVDVRPVGLFRMSDEAGVDDKVLAIVCASDPVQHPERFVEQGRAALRSFARTGEIDELRAWLETQDAGRMHSRAALANALASHMQREASVSPLSERAPARHYGSAGRRDK